MSDIQKNVTYGRHKGCPDFSPEFKQQLVAVSWKSEISISKLVLENGINANLLFKWRQQWREGTPPLPSSERTQLLPVTLDADRGPEGAQYQLWGNVLARDAPPQRYCQRKASDFAD